MGTCHFLIYHLGQIYKCLKLEYLSSLSFLLWLIYVRSDLLLCNFSKVRQVLLLTAEVRSARITVGDQSTTKRFPLKEFKGCLKRQASPMIHQHNMSRRGGGPLLVAHNSTAGITYESVYQHDNTLWESSIIITIILILFVQFPADWSSFNIKWLKHFVFGGLYILHPCYYSCY